MPRILIVDPEITIQNEIKKTLQDLNSQNSVDCFLNFKDIETHHASLPTGPFEDFYKFDLIIFCYSLLNPKEWADKINEFKKINQIETTFLFTTYDSKSLNRKYMSHLPVHNVLYKPFDRLILKESLNLAFHQKEFSKPIELIPQPAKAFVSILKEIELISICELGFVSLNEGPIPTGSTSKYLKDIFSHGKRQSVWAQCIMSLEIPNQPGHYINKFQFVGIEHSLLMNLRHFLSENKHKRVANAVWNLESKGALKTVNLALVSTHTLNVQKFKHDIESHYTNAHVDLIEFDLTKLSQPIAHQYDCIINLNEDLEFEALKNYFVKESQYLMVAQNKLDEEKFRKNQSFYRDIFTAPLDKSFFYKKLKIFIQDLQFVEPAELLNISYPEKIKALHMVKILDICETYVTFNYHRELDLGTFREFAFVNDDENQVIELPAACHFFNKAKSEANEKSVQYLHQFVFWGMTDYYLKQIRMWLLHNYIVQNQAENKSN